MGPFFRHAYRRRSDAAEPFVASAREERVHIPTCDVSSCNIRAPVALTSASCGRAFRTRRRNRGRRPVEPSNRATQVARARQRANGCRPVRRGPIMLQKGGSGVRTMEGRKTRSPNQIGTRRTKFFSFPRWRSCAIVGRAFEMEVKGSGVGGQFGGGFSLLHWPLATDHFSSVPASDLSPLPYVLPMHYAPPCQPFRR